MAVDPARAKTLFLNALEIADPLQRSAFLDRESGGDAELRQWVEALLAADSQGGSTSASDSQGTFVPISNETMDPAVADEANTHPSSELATAQYRPESADDADCSFADTSPDDRISRCVGGQVIAGRYTLLQVIGEGGMGSVYLASQSQPVKRQVALKLIKTGMKSRDVLARFDAERQALAMMDHPNIARIYDGGVTEAGQPFFVMELVEGIPLTKYCDLKRLTVKDRLELFVAVCQAVQHAHQKGIIHRDLKPTNVLVTEVDGRPTPKVIDFGVAKATEQKLTDMSFADTGVIVGTPAYMSPEQADPSSMDIDTRTDIYALGVMLYELLVGSPPLDAQDFKRGALLEMLRMVRDVDPPRPSTKLSGSDTLPNIAANRNIEPAKLSKLLQGELDWVVMKAIEKDRNRRYDTANGLAADIQHYLADEMVEARPPSRGYRLRKFVKRNKVQVLAGSLVIWALLAGMAGTTWQAIRAERARAEATENADTAVQVANDLSSFADKIAFFGLQATISDTERKKVIDSNLVSYKRLLELQPENAEIQASVGRMHRYRANLCRGLDETAEAEKSYTQALGCYSTLSQKYPEDKRFKQSQAEIARDFAMLLKRIGRLKQASSLLQDSVREYEKLQIAESSSTDIQRVQANILIDQADLEYELGRFVDSERTARKAIAIYVRLIDTPRSHPDVLEPLFQSMAENRLAMCLREQGRIDEALVAHSEAVGRSMTLIKTNPSRDFLAFSYRNRAERAYTLSRIPDQRQTAWDEFSESIAGCAKLSKQFPDFSFYRHGQAQSTLWRARLNLLMDRKDDAIKDLATAADILGELMVKYPTIVDYRLDAGLTSLAQAELAATPEEANPFYRKAREAIEECMVRNPESESCRKALDQLNRPPNKP